jgi:hypothetical protein
VFLAYEVLKTNEDISHLIVGVLPQASFRLTTVEGDIPSTESKPSAPTTVVAPAQWREVSRQTYAASPKWTQRAGARPPRHHQLSELTHLLSEGNPMRWRVQPRRQRCRISVGSNSRHGPLTTTYTSPSQATFTLLVHGLIATRSISGCNPRHVLGRGPCARQRCGRLRLWLRRRLRRWLWWQVLCPGCPPRCTPSNPVTWDTRMTRFLERNGQWPLAIQLEIRVR